ncbi:MAG TPA: kynureninase [Nocardioides sp.]|nr:kynureninase [Nocardioides sp.]
MTTREDAIALDAADPLASYRDRFALPDDLNYLDGNSLGALPRATSEWLAQVVQREWGERLIRSWNEGWHELPVRVGDLIGRYVLGAGAGQVALADSTTVNFYKLLGAALDARPGRSVIVSDPLNFPTDRYVVEGIARSRDLTVLPLAADPVLGVTPADVEAVVGPDTAVVTLSQVDYRSGALADLHEITRIAHAAGALVLWDLCHSAGAVPIDLDAAGVDLAVGCTYKYLNGGPGAPAFLYVASRLQDELTPPIWGWFGQADQFAMGPSFTPVAGIRRFLSGTPSILAGSAVEAGIELFAEAGIDRIRAKSVDLTSLAVSLYDEHLAALGFTLVTPRDAAARGGHVSVSHPEAYRICKALIELEDTVPDFREPDGLRLGFSPLTTRFVDVWDGIDSIRRIVEEKLYERVSSSRSAVT